MLPINYTAVLFAAVAAFVVGFLIHGPLFGKLWMRLAHVHPKSDEKMSDMMPQMIKNLIANLVSAYVLAMFYVISTASPLLAGASGVVGGMIIATLMWIGFNVTATSMEYIWMGRSLKHWAFNICSSLAVYLTMGAIIGWM